MAKKIKKDEKNHERTKYWWDDQGWNMEELKEHYNTVLVDLRAIMSENHQQFEKIVAITQRNKELGEEIERLNGTLIKEFVCRMNFVLEEMERDRKNVKYLKQLDFSCLIFSYIKWIKANLRVISEEKNLKVIAFDDAVNSFANEFNLDEQEKQELKENLQKDTEEKLDIQQNEEIDNFIDEPEQSDTLDEPEFFSKEY